MTERTGAPHRNARSFAFFLVTLLFALAHFSGAAGENGGKGLALFIGVGEYDAHPPIASAVNDAINLARTFDASGDFRRIFVLSDIDAHGNPNKANALPTRDNILKTLQMLANNATREARLTVYFNGHGVTRDGKTYLLPSDAAAVSGDAEPGIPLADVVAVMKRSRAVTKMLILDAWHDDNHAADATGDLDALGDDFAVITACDAGQASLVDASGIRGVFSLALAAALSGDADENADGAFTAAELLAFMDGFIGDYCLDNLVVAAQTPKTPGDASGAALVRGYAVAKPVTVVASEKKSAPAAEAAARPDTAPQKTGAVKNAARKEPVKQTARTAHVEPAKAASDPDVAAESHTHPETGLNGGKDASGGVTSTMIKPIAAGPEKAGMRLVRVDDMGGETQPGLLAPTQAFEIIRPDMEEITIGRLGTSCSCIKVVAAKRTFAKGERAILELRNVTPTTPEGMNYAVYVLVLAPEEAVLRQTTFVRSESVDDATGEDASFDGPAGDAEAKLARQTEERADEDIDALLAEAKQLAAAGDAEAALAAYLPLARRGVAEAEYFVGDAYQFGRGVGQDYAESLRWLVRAGNQGHIKAQELLATIYYYGRGVTADAREAAKWSTLKGGIPESPEPPEDDRSRPTDNTGKPATATSTEPEAPSTPPAYTEPQYQSQTPQYQQQYYNQPEPTPIQKAGRAMRRYFLGR